MPRDHLINSATGNTIIKSHLDIIGKMVINDLSGTPATASDGTLVINHGRRGSASSIVFTSASNPNSDYAYIQYQDTRDAGLESSLLTIGVENDGAAHAAARAVGLVENLAGRSGDDVGEVGEESTLPRQKGARAPRRGVHGEQCPLWVKYIHRIDQRTVYRG
jgi:hypothetical protein